MLYLEYNMIASPKYFQNHFLDIELDETLQTGKCKRKGNKHIKKNKVRDREKRKKKTNS